MIRSCVKLSYDHAQVRLVCDVRKDYWESLLNIYCDAVVMVFVTDVIGTAKLFVSVAEVILFVSDVAKVILFATDVVEVIIFVTNANEVIIFVSDVKLLYL